MNGARIADTKPAVVQLEAGTHWWCACGRSQTQPFCDGAHKGSGFAPVKIELEKPERIALCNCKQTSTPPNCDGSHRRLPS